MIVYFAATRNAPVYTPDSLENAYKSSYINHDNPNSVNLIINPITKTFLQSTFIIRSVVNYEIKWDGKEFKPGYDDQQFFDEFTIIRDSAKGFISFTYPGILFFAEEPVEVTISHPVFETNEFANKTRVISGTFDVGQHLRKIEAAFFFKDKGKVFIGEGDPLYYVTFNTKEKIEFKRFYLTKDLFTFYNQPLHQIPFTKKIKPLEWWYKKNAESGRIKKYLKIIKQNLYE